MARQTNTLEGGSNGVTVTTVNSGGASGNAFSRVNIATGGSVIFDAASVKNGSMGLKMTTGTTGSSYVQLPYAAAADFSVQGWWNFDAAPASATEGPLSVRVTGTNAFIVRTTFLTTRRLTITDTVGSSSSTAVLSAATWYYLDFYGTGLNGASGSFALDVYSANGTLFTSVTFTGRTTAALASLAEWGTHSSVVGLTHHFDDLSADLAAGAAAAGFPVPQAEEYVMRGGLLTPVTQWTKRGGVLV